MADLITDKKESISCDEIFSMNFPQYLRYLNRLGVSVADLKKEYNYITYNYIWTAVNPRPSKARRRKVKLWRNFLKDWRDSNEKIIFMFSRIAI